MSELDARPVHGGNAHDRRRGAAPDGSRRRRGLDSPPGTNSEPAEEAWPSRLLPVFLVFALRVGWVWWGSWTERMRHPARSGWVILNQPTATEWLTSGVPHRGTRRSLVRVWREAQDAPPLWAGGMAGVSSVRRLRVLSRRPTWTTAGVR